MIDKAVNLAQKVRDEIANSGWEGVVVNGILRRRNSLNRDNVFAGNCGGGVARFTELAEDTRITGLSFHLRHPQTGSHGRHNVIEFVDEQRQRFIVDPTIEQYFPSARTYVYLAELYPIKIIGEPLRINRENLLR